MMKYLSITFAMLTLTGSAWAQTANSWLIQGGATHIAPNVSSGTLSAPAPANTQIDVGSDARATAQVAYMLTDSWSIAVPLGAGFKHKLYGAGGIAGVGQIGTVTALPITAFLQYRLGTAQEQIRPYAMLGASYVRFRDAQGSATLNGINPANPPSGNTGLSVDSKMALSTGLGVYVQVKDDWFVDLSYAKTYLSTTATLSTGQTISTKLNPHIFSIGVGKRF
jgi:outer membrane protein